MARFNAKSLQHKEDFFILPEEIIIDETWNGRFEPHSEEDVRERAIDLLLNGQYAPVGIRKAHDEKSKPKLVYGFLRTRAGVWINKNVVPNGGIDIPAPTDKDPNAKLHIDRSEPFKVHCMSVGEVDDIGALLKNIGENKSVKGTTIMDMVSNQNRLWKLYNEDWSKVATAYNTSVPMLKRIAPLMSLPHEVQLMIHRGIISAEAGLHLVTVSSDEQKQIIADTKAELAKNDRMPLFEHSEQFYTQMPGEDTDHPDYQSRSVRVAFTESDASTPSNGNEVDGGGKQTGKKTTKKVVKKTGGKQRPLLSTRSIKAGVRKVKEKKGEKGPGLSMAEFMGFFAEMVGPDSDSTIPEPVKEFCEQILKFRRSEISKGQMHKALTKLYKAVPESAAVE